MKLKILLLGIVIMLTNNVFGQSFGALNTSITCLNTELDGSMTLRVTGVDEWRHGAKKQACKNAVYNVIFKGVKSEDKNSRHSRPLVYEVNAEEKYADFIADFFKDGGEYEEFVKVGRWIGRSRTHKIKDRKIKERSVTVTVFRADLEKYLISKNIIKKH